MKKLLFLALLFTSATQALTPPYIGQLAAPPAKSDCRGLILYELPYVEELRLEHCVQYSGIPEDKKKIYDELVRSGGYARLEGYPAAGTLDFYSVEPIQCEGQCNCKGTLVFCETRRTTTGCYNACVKQPW